MASGQIDNAFELNGSNGHKRGTEGDRSSLLAVNFLFTSKSRPLNCWTPRA